MNSTDNSDIQVKTFTNPDEIRNLKGFKHGNPVNNRNYKRIIGDYWFPNEVRCCYQKENQKLCNESHKWGFVAKLADDTITIVGNKCANDKFGANSKIKADRSRYLNEKRRQESLTRLKVLLTESEAKLEKLTSAQREIEVLRKRVIDLKAKLGSGTVRVMENMGRSKNNSVLVEAITIKETIDEDGKESHERIAIKQSIGSLSGLNCLSISTYTSIESEILSARAAYKNAENLESNASSTKIKQLVSAMDALPRIEDAVSNLRKSVDLFIENDPLLFCFLSSDKSERYKSAQLALEKRGRNSGKDKAKAWLAKQELSIAESINADKVMVI